MSKYLVYHDSNLHARLFAHFTAVAPDMSIGAALHITHAIMNNQPQTVGNWLIMTHEAMQLRLPERCSPPCVCVECGYQFSGAAETPEEKCFCYHPF